MRTLVLGLGNPILTDDGVGIRIVREAEVRLASGGRPRAGITFAEASVGGLRLLDLLGGHDRAILVDAIQTRGGRPGDCYRLKAGDLRTSRHAGSAHDLTLPEALAFGRLLGMTVPADDAIDIFAVEAEDVLTFGEACTAAVEAAIPGAAEAVLEMAGLIETAGQRTPMVESELDQLGHQ